MSSSIEQICRDVLEQAIKDGIVRFCDENFVSTDGPQSLTAGDLCGVANVLRDRLADLNDRWQRAVGMPLEAAEELAASLTSAPTSCPSP